MSRYEITYSWKLREIMAQRGVHTAKDLADLLHERGITLTPNAIWRIVTQEPERIAFKVLVALCDALDVSPNDLITYAVTDAKTLRKRSNATGQNLPELRQYRPVRARIVEDDE